MRRKYVFKLYPFIVYKPGTNPLVVMTKCDKICSFTEKDTSKVFHSQEVKNKVRSEP